VEPKRSVDDREAGSYLKYLALVEIRSMARRRKPMSGWSDDDYVACIAWLADLCHNMPTSGPGPRGTWWRGRSVPRPFDWAWKVADPAGRAWILASLDKAGMDWTPPSAHESAGQTTQADGSVTATPADTTVISGQPRTVNERRELARKPDTLNDELA